MQSARPDRRRSMVHSAYGKNLAARQASANRKRRNDSARESRLRQGIVVGWGEQGANARQEAMTYGDTSLSAKRKKQGYGLDRTLATLSINQQPDDYALFGLG